MNLQPLKLLGEGEYNVNDLKEIKVTDSYLDLDENTRNCQNEETFENCTTRHYIETILIECGCLPFNIHHPKKVFYQNNGFKILCFISIFLQGPLCSTSQVECINRVQFDSSKSTCAKSCYGLIVTGVSKSGQHMNKNIEGILLEEMTSYNDFTKWKHLRPYLKGKGILNFTLYS